MCRLAAYIGPSISLQSFLIAPEHGLIKQSWAPRDMKEAVLNADGFGLGWYTEHAGPAIYLNESPIWSDINLKGLSVSLTSPVWLGYVRSATDGQMTGLINTQPFVADKLMYIHNGNIKNFKPQHKISIHQYLLPEIQADIHGNTDSEFLFAILRQQILQNPQRTLGENVKDMMHAIAEIIGTGSALLNIIISDGKSILATRHAINGECPTLYYTTGSGLYPAGCVMASEKLSDEDNWETVPENTLLWMDGVSAHGMETL